MTELTTTGAEQPAHPPASARLRPGPRKLVLLLHIVSAGTWIGIEVVMAVLIFTALLSSDPQTSALCYQALELFAVWPLVIAGLAALVTGVTMGLGTGYGLVRYWWVTVKLVINIGMLALALLALRPAIDAAAEYGRRLADGLPPGPDQSALVYPPTISLALLVFAVFLAIFKPWGRIRHSSR